MTRVTRLEDLVGCLQKLAPAEVCIDAVSEILSAADLADSDVRRFVAFSPEKYTRHLVHRDDLFDVMVICWDRGQCTPVHNHNGQMGWIRVLQGRIEETHFTFPDGGSTLDLTQVEIDDDGVGHHVDLERQQTAAYVNGPAVSTVDAARGIHQVANRQAHADDDRAVTLHVYSRPHDTCLAFDLKARTCRRRNMVFDSTPAGYQASPGLG